MTLCRGLAHAAAAGVLLAGAEEALSRATSVEEAQAAATPLQLVKPEPSEIRLGNGLRAWHLESDRLPLVTVRAVVRAGAIWESADRSGVADLTGRMLRAGGSAAWPADRLDDELDYLAAELSSEIGNEQGHLTLEVLVEEIDAALPIFADVLRNPAFQESKIAIHKDLILEEIRRQNDNPIQVAVREYGKLIWGADHPRARTPSEEGVGALTREDLVRFHERFFRPGNILIGVAGDISRKEARDALERAFGDWKGENVALPDVPPAPEVVPRVAMARKDVPQSTVILGHLGPREDDPHRASGEVMMHILGSGGFTSYITDQVRNDEGLAYFAGAFLTFGRLDAGTVVAVALSKSETTCRAADLMLEQIERIRTVDVTDEELARARDAILNSQAFEYDSTQEVVTSLMDRVYFGLPEDHEERVVERIGRVNKADVRDAANALLHPERLSIIAVGDDAAMDCSLARYAERLGCALTEIEVP